MNQNRIWRCSFAPQKQTRAERSEIAGLRRCTGLRGSIVIRAYIILVGSLLLCFYFYIFSLSHPDTFLPPPLSRTLVFSECGECNFHFQVAFRTFRVHSQAFLISFCRRTAKRAPDQDFVSGVLQLLYYCQRKAARVFISFQLGGKRILLF